MLIDDDLGSDSAPGIPRRSMLRAAAWAVPVIVVTTAVPAFAASVDAISFDSAAYTGTPCGLISGVTVTLTSGGAAVSSEAITVVLTGGYTFSADGSTTSSGVTGADGTLVLSSIRVPNVGGTGTITATVAATSSVTTTASATAAPPSVTALQFAGASSGATWSVPFDATPLGNAYFLYSNGDVYYNGTRRASDVRSADTVNNGGANWAGTIDSSGTFRQLRDGAVFATASAGVGAEAVGVGYWLTAAGGLFYVDQPGTALITGVVDADSINDGAANRAAALASDGKLVRFSKATRQATEYAVPATAKVVGYSFWLVGTSLFHVSDVNTAVATDIASADSEATANSRAPGNVDLAGAVSTGGQHRVYTSRTASGLGAVGAGASAIGVYYSLAPDGALFYNTTRVGGANAIWAKAAGVMNSSGAWVTAMPYPAACAV